jgi:hypothetical protein
MMFWLGVMVASVVASPMLWVITDNPFWLFYLVIGIAVVVLEALAIRWTDRHDAWNK